MPEVYNIADVMFLPSFEELFPMTVLEAMSCHIPMLLRDIDIYKDILFDFYLKDTDVDGFVSRIDRLRKGCRLLRRGFECLRSRTRILFA